MQTGVHEVGEEYQKVNQEFNDGANNGMRLWGLGTSVGVSLAAEDDANRSPSTVDQMATFANRGHSAGARWIPETLEEDLALRVVMADPACGRLLPVPMTDLVWPQDDGWVKM